MILDINTLLILPVEKGNKFGKYISKWNWARKAKMEIYFTLNNQLLTPEAPYSTWLVTVPKYHLNINDRMRILPYHHLQTKALACACFVSV